MRNALFLVSLACFAQSQLDLGRQGKNVDFSAAPSTRPVKIGTTLPVSCLVGELFFKADAPAGANLYACTSANIWTVSSGAASNSVSMRYNGTPVGSQPNLNIVPGTGILLSLTNNPGSSSVDLTASMDTAYTNTIYPQLAGSNIYGAGARQTMRQSANAPGIRIEPGATDPSSPLAGDLVTNTSGDLKGYRGATDGWHTYLSLPAISGASNQVAATPASGSGRIALRSLDPADIPSLTASKLTSGVLAPARVISGTITNTRCLHVDGSGDITTTASDCSAPGPPGATGATGVTGPTGATGPMGERPNIYALATSSSPTTYVGGLNPALTQYVNGLLILFDVGGTGCSGSVATTLNIDSLGAKRLYLADGLTDPTTEDCPAGRNLVLAYDAALGGGVGAWRIIGGGRSSGPKAAYTVATGTSVLGTTPIASGTCAAVVSSSAVGVSTSDVIQRDFASDPTGVTGYAPTSNGTLNIISYPTANNVNWKVCNSTNASITPGAMTLNWRVTR